MSLPSAMTMALPITATTLREAVTRRLVQWGLALSAVYVGLFALGYTLLYREVVEANAASQIERAIAGTLLTILGLYAASFMSCFLALLVAAGSVSAEIDSGTALAVLARPIRRTSWLLQRWLGLALLVGGYTALMAIALLTVARLVSDYQPLDPARTVALMLLQTQVLLALGIWTSTRLSPVTNGIVLFLAYGISWLGGIVGFVGRGIGKTGMVDVATAVGLLVPSDGLWRGASYYATPEIVFAEFGPNQGLPFASVQPPAGPFLLWSAGYLVLMLTLATRSFARRDI